MIIVSSFSKSMVKRSITTYLFMSQSFLLSLSSGFVFYFFGELSQDFFF